MKIADKNLGEKKSTKEAFLITVCGSVKPAGKLTSRSFFQ